ncbi:hypothetical protein [Ectobacillus polymachus]|uniref:hypothetical protein n=1 Tax=Ectobacillus polymachus TaxID=1508806 RepID=UPI003A864563
MKIKFCLADGGDLLFVITSEDVAGIIEASKGEKIVYSKKSYKYDHHILNHIEPHFLEVIVYVNEY